MHPNDGTGQYDPAKAARENLGLSAPPGIEKLRPFPTRQQLDRGAAAIATSANGIAAVQQMSPHELILDQLLHTQRRTEQIRQALTVYRSRILGPVPINPANAPTPEHRDTPLIPAMQAVLERIHLEFEIIEQIIYQI